MSTVSRIGLRACSALRAPGYCKLSASGIRQFSTATDPLLASASTEYDRVKKLGVEMYHAQKQEVDSEMSKLLSENKLIVFLEGSVDKPKSEVSLNTVKILTQAQAVPITSVDVLAHPAILGWFVTKT